MSSDFATELATLVADTLAAAEVFRATGASVVPSGALDGLPPAEPWTAMAAGGGGPARPEPPGPTLPYAPSEAARAPSPRPPPPRPSPPRPSFGAAAPAATASAAPAAPAAPRPTAAAAASRSAPPSGGALAARVGAPSADGGLAGLFGGKWAAALRNRGEELREMLAALAPCPDCGTAPSALPGVGKADAPLLVLTVGPDGAPLGAEGAAMLERMLLNVLSVERGDVWLVEANACAAAGGGCRIGLRRQIDVVNPRLVLAMGFQAGVVLGGGCSARGEWTPFGGADVMTTFHPVELLARPSDKRPTLEHLTLLRARL